MTDDLRKVIDIASPPTPTCAPMPKTLPPTDERMRMRAQIAQLEWEVAKLKHALDKRDMALAEAVYLSNLEVQHQKESGGDLYTVVVVAKEIPCQSSVCPNLADWIENEWSKR